MSIVFIKKRGCTSNVRVARFTICKVNGQLLGRFVVQKKIARKISKTGYMAVGVDTERRRLYFAAADSVTGYKMTDQKEQSAIRFTLPANGKGFDIFVGDHAVYHDDEIGMYYIEVGGDDE